MSTKNGITAGKVILPASKEVIKEKRKQAQPTPMSLKKPRKHTPNVLKEIF